MKTEKDVQIGAWSKGILVSVSFVLMLLAAEVILYTFGYTPRYTGDQELDNPVPSPFWVFDPAFGLRFNAEGAQPHATGSRLGLVNDQGFSDTDDFSYRADLDSIFRILAVGDSFTWGASSRLGHSFIEVLEESLSTEAVVWNAAIPATATEQALKTLKSLAPVMRPDLILLGFYMNDFEGNLYPMDSYLRRKDFKAIHLYTLDEAANPQRLPPDAAFQRAFNFRPARDVSSLLYALRRTRLFSTIETAWERKWPWAKARIKAVLLRTLPSSTALHKRLDKQRMLQEEARMRRATKRHHIWEKSVELTRTYLRDIRDFAQDQGIELLVLLIPRREDVVRPTQSYTAAIDLMDNLSVAYLEALPVLQEQDYAALPDNHWNNEGHFKAGALLIERIRRIITTQEANKLHPTP